MTRRPTLATAGLAMTALWAATDAVTGTPPSLTTKAGVYSESQAAEGGQIYAQRCAMCHGRMLEGTAEIPSLTGRLIANWGHKPLGDLYDYVGRAMPQSAPGSLTPEENARLVAFLLQANGMPAGRAALPADSARLHAIALEPARPAQ